MKPEPLGEDSRFLKQTITSLSDQIDLFETFQSLSLQIISQFDLDNIFTVFTGIINEVMPFEQAAIFLKDPKGDSFQPAWQSNGPAKLTEPACFDADGSNEMDDNILDWIMEKGGWTVLTDIQDKTVTKICSILPLKSPKRAIGIMIIQTKFTSTTYNRKISSILDFLASQTAIAIENHDLYSTVNRSHTHMTNLMESISNGIMSVDMEGCITLINKNATALLGIKGKKIIGRHYSRFISGPVKTLIDSIFHAARKNRVMPESMANHSPFRSVDIVLGVTGSLLTDKSRQTSGVIFSLRDMSASKEIERLTRLDQMKSEFVSNVSHELKTPLSIIKSYAEALHHQVKPDDKETRDKFLSVIEDETDRLSGMVSDLLDLSRMESNNYRPDYDTVCMKTLVENVAQIFRSHPNIQVYTESEADLPDIEVDREKIRDVLINLVGNSVKFSPKGGTIHIQLKKTQSRWVTCSIADTGIGIPQAELGKIFQKFYRVDSSDTSEIEGSGLGLSIVNHIINCHHGKIDVESVVGKGSVFTFSLPVKKGDHEVS